MSSVEEKRRKFTIYVHPRRKEVRIFLMPRINKLGVMEVHDSCKYIESEMLDNREEENHQRKERRERDKGESTCVFGEVEQVRNYRENMAP